MKKMLRGSIYYICARISYVVISIICVYFFSKSPEISQQDLVNFLYLTSASIILSSEANRIARVVKHRKIFSSLLLRKTIILFIISNILCIPLITKFSSVSEAILAIFFLVSIFFTKLMPFFCHKEIRLIVYLLIILSATFFASISPTPLEIILFPGSLLAICCVFILAWKSRRHDYSVVVKLMNFNKYTMSFYFYEASVAVSFIIETVYFMFKDNIDNSVSFIVLQRYSGYFIAAVSLIFGLKQFLILNGKRNLLNINFFQIIIMFMASIGFMLFSQLAGITDLKLILAFSFLVFFQLTFGYINSSYVTEKLSSHFNVRLGVIVLLACSVSYVCLIVWDDILVALIAKSLVLTGSLKLQLQRLSGGEK